MNKNANEKILDFLGYYLLKCNFSRTIESRTADSIYIVAKCQEPSNQIVNLIVHIDLEFSNNTKSSFDYVAQFRLYDEDWFKIANETQQNIGIANLFSISFPYIRTSLFNITSDSLGPVAIPVLNASLGDITKGLRLTREQRTKNKKA